MSQSGVLNRGVFPPFSVVETLEGNTGGPVGPDGANNINVVGDGTTITIAGNPGTNTLTASVTGIVADSFPTDSGTAVPAAGALTITAGFAAVTCGATVKFTGSGSTVALHLTDSQLNNNTLLGDACGFYLTTGRRNTGLGSGAISGNPVGISGNDNTCVGDDAGFDILASEGCCAFGSSALANGHPGNFNISIGFESSFNFTGGEDSTIIIGNPGVGAESHTIRIGTTGVGDQEQNQCYIAGIQTVNVGSVATVVSINGDHLGQATITAGSGIAVTTGSNTITIAATGGGFTWHDVTGGSATLAAQNGYIADAAGLTTFTMPTNNAFGDTIKIVGKGSGGWKIVYGAGQNIIFGSSASTATTGNISSINAHDCAEMVCTTASASAPIFTIVNAVGNLSIT